MRKTYHLDYEALMAIPIPPPRPNAHSNEGIIVSPVTQTPLLTLSAEKIAYEIRKAMLVLGCNVHDPHHLKGSCDNRPDMKCRYHFPRVDILEETFVDEDHVVRAARALGSEYVNAFSIITHELLKSNHDLTFLIGEDSAGRIHYVVGPCPLARNYHPFH